MHFSASPIPGNHILKVLSLFGLYLFECLQVVQNETNPLKKNFSLRPNQVNLVDIPALVFVSWPKVIS
jgi:hypothetical protein